ncbi:MAG: hypothetical protein J0I47_06130 [Sphingomonas sp.]|uniref:DUF6680 family protein n=1 Tax=Sphingomonas sp. TaxID=28214 RepID=UPI001AD5A0C1|nr:DUF6680 family protein [Sphingomonas sp.]MBN8807797.1 hypothetical protein [Sphingomonas sp.]
MPPATVPETLYWGLKFSEWISLAGILIGPIVAVVITLIVDGKRKRHDARHQIIRMLLASRHLVGDATYSTAINLIPAEFNSSKAVMAAWHDYIEHVRFKPSEENKEAHEKLHGAKQTKLIFEAMKEAGFKLAETDIQTSGYAADAYIMRDNILVASQIAMADIANILRQQTELLRPEPVEASPSPRIGEKG